MSNQIDFLVTIIVKAFERPTCLTQLLTSIRRFYPTVRIIVADDSQCPQRPSGHNVTYLPLPFDVGAAAARNAMMMLVQTPYTLKVDDDFVFTHETDLQLAVDVLKTTKASLVAGSTVWLALGAAGAQGELRLREYEGLFKVRDRKLYACAGNRGRLDKWFQYDLVSDFYLARTEVLRRHGWDARYKISGIHTDFFWRAWKKLCIVHEPRLRVLHFPVRSRGYAAYRRRPVYSRQMLKQHGFHEFVHASTFSGWHPFDQRLEKYAPWLVDATGQPLLNRTGLWDPERGLFWEEPKTTLPLQQRVATSRVNPIRVLIIRDTDTWASASATQALAVHLKDEFVCETRLESGRHRPILYYEEGDERFDIVYIHCSMGLFGSQVNQYRLRNPHSRILIGVRGWMGFRAIGSSLKLYDGVNVNNEVLLEAVRKVVPHVHLCHAGVDTTQFTPTAALPQAKSFIAGWVGDMAKEVKNADQLPFLGVPYRVAAKPGQGESYTHQEMPKFYNTISVLLMLSAHPNWPTAEGCPLPVLEAASCGRPVLATRTAGAAPEFLESFQVVHRPLHAGGLDEFRYKLRYLATHPEFAMELGARNRKLACAEWDWSYKAKQYANFFKDTLRRPCVG